MFVVLLLPTVVCVQISIHKQISAVLKTPQDIPFTHVYLRYPNLDVLSATGGSIQPAPNVLKYSCKQRGGAT